MRNTATNARVLAVAIRTPPHQLVLSKAVDSNALKLIAQDLQDEPLPGVSGLVTEVETFLQDWQTLTGQSYRRVMAMKNLPVNRGQSCHNSTRAAPACH